MHFARRTLVWVVAAVAWSCAGSPTGVDRGPGNAVAAIAIDPVSATLTVGTEAPLQATVRDESGRILPTITVVWSVKDSSIASVSSAGVVSARSIGNTQIAASANGLSAYAAVAVQRVPVASVLVQPLTQVLVSGQTASFTATARDRNGTPLANRVVTWTSSNESIALVSQNGDVTGRAVGSATITATSEGASGSATVTVSPVPVASVSLQPTTAALIVGDTTSLTAVVRDANGAVVTDRPVIWQSDNASVASVSVTGVVAARSIGSATISATSEGKTSTATIAVTADPVASITIAPSSAALVAGGTVTLVATTRNAGGAVLADRAVIWSSSSPGVATVSSTGVVTAIAPGSTTITASSEGRSAIATATVTLVPVGSVAVLPMSATVTIGQTATLSAAVRDTAGAVVTDRVVTWASSNMAVATVSKVGVVTGIAPGSATISATSGGKTGSATVDVIPVSVESVTVAPSATTLVPTQTVSLTTVIRDANDVVVKGRAVTWTSSNTAVATVSGSGMVTAVAPGTAEVTATSEGKSGSSSITVVRMPVGSVAVSPATASIAVGQTLPLSATVRDTSGSIVTDRAVTWKSSNTAVAAVSSTGVVTAVNAGTAAITATSEGKSSGALVAVTTVPVASVTLAPSIVTITAGQTATLVATTKSADGTTLTGRSVTFTSDHPGVVTVSTTGVITGVAPGTATVTATSEGKSGSARVTVNPVPVGSVAVSPATANITDGQTLALTVTVEDTRGVVVTDRAVTWNSSNTRVATVSSTGVVTARDTGTATITATSEGKSGGATVTVTPVPVASVTLAPGTVTITAGQTATLVATTKSADGTTLNGRAVTFTSDNVGVARVSSDGVVTGTALGTATITATSEGKSATATVTVQPTVAYVVVSPGVVVLKKGGTLQLSATAYDASNNKIVGRVITWDSDDDHIATVSTTGLLTAKKSGGVTISATVDGKTGTTKVIVTS